MEWCYELPTKKGKYIIQTKSNLFGTVTTLESKYDPKSQKQKWSISMEHRSFYRYLKVP
jgi:hypothetical protein